jgi:hypothetical protein
VTGLAGHAFGSWRSRETRFMWLKDFLPNDVKNIRIMTYGYDSRIVGSEQSGARMSDYRRNFIEQLETSRTSAKVCKDLFVRGSKFFADTTDLYQNRPIIFLGHSLGGILILQVSVCIAL